MADDIKLRPLVVDISATTARLEKALKRVESQNRATMNKVQRDATVGMKRFEGALASADRRMAGFGRTLLPSLGGIAAALSIREVARYADAWTRAKNSLAVAGVTGQAQVKVLDQLYNAAQRNAAPVGALADLYGKAAQASDVLGASQAELIKFSSGVATALRVAGTSAGAASGALTQLGQLLGQARVQAEEFNSINEGARPILMAVAQGLDAAGGSVSKLKTLVNDGKVSGRQFFEAFLKGLPQVEAMAANATTTIEQGWTKVGNALTRYIGSTDESLGASQRLVTGLSALADNFDETADMALNLASVVAGALIGRAVTGLIAKLPAATSAVVAFYAALKTARTLSLGASFASLGAAAGPVGAIIGGAVVTSLIAFSGKSEEASLAAKTYAGALEQVRAKASETADAIDGTTTAIDERMRNALSGGIDQAEAEIAGLLSEIDKILESVEGVGGSRLATEEQFEQLRQLRAGLAGGATSADDAQQALFALANLNPNFQRLADQLDPLLSRLADVMAAIGIMRTQLDEVSRDPRIDAYRQYGESRRAADAMTRAASEFEQEQLRRAGLTREQLKLEQEIAKVRNDALKEGVTLTETQIENIAKANNAGDEARSNSGRKERISDYDALRKRIGEATAALVAEQNALRSLNPYIDDYGFALERARVEAELLAAAQESGLPITAELEQQIASIADGYARAAAGANKLSEHHDELRSEMERSLQIVEDGFTGLLDVLYGDADDFFDNLMKGFAAVGRQFAELGMERLWKSMTGEAGAIFNVPSAPSSAPSPAQSQQVGREIGNAIAPSISTSLNDNLTSFAAAIRKIESGSYEGNYSARGPVVQSGRYAGDRAYGAYQVMGKNIASWTKEVLGYSMTMSEFVADRAAQDAVFFKKFGASVEKFGTFSDAASVWFSGRPLSRAGNASDGYNTVPAYVQKANDALANYPGGMRGAIADGTVDAWRKVPHLPEMAGQAANGFAPTGSSANLESMMGVGSAALGAFAGGFQSGNPLMGGISGALTGLGAAPAIASAFPALAGAAGPIGLIGGAVIGLIGGLIGKARQKRQELKQAQQELESQMGAITDLIATATGNFMGTYEKTIMQTADEFSKAIAMANKAKNKELADELTDAQDEFYKRMTERWEKNFEGMVASMDAGLGLDSEYMSGMDAVEKMRESLVGFINDAKLFVDANGDLAAVIKNRKLRFGEESDKPYEFQAEYNAGRYDAGVNAVYNMAVEGYRDLGDQIIKFGVQAYTQTGGMLYESVAALKEAAIAQGLAIDDVGVVTEAAANASKEYADDVERVRQASIKTALAMLSGAEEFTAMEEAVQRLEGTMENLPSLLKDLGVSAEDAAAAITNHANIAMAKLRDAYRDELNASINDLSGFGFLNEIIGAMDRYDERLKDSVAIGLDASLATRELNLAFADIVDSADLTQAQIDMLAAAFPLMSGLIETVAGKDAIAMVEEAESNLRSAYERQKSEIETTVSRLERFTDSVKRFRDEMRINDSSPLSQREQTEEALRQFRETLALALSGDEEAQDKLTNVSQSALDEARAYYASSEKYAAIWNEIDSGLDQVAAKAGQQLTEHQKELERLDALVSGWITINDSILSVADAIAALANATTERDRALQDQIDAAKNSGAETRSAEIAALYQSILGRSGSASEIDWWANKTTKSVDTIRADMEWAKSTGSFQSGGFTGMLPTNAIAGVVHGQEFVANAEATRRWRPQLEAMNMGHALSDGSAGVVAAIGRLEQQNRELQREVKQLRSAVGAAGTMQVELLKQSKDEFSHVSQELKRFNARY